jgi:hypothetical protein
MERDFIQSNIFDDLMKTMCALHCLHIELIHPIDISHFHFIKIT